MQAKSPRPVLDRAHPLARGLVAAWDFQNVNPKASGRIVRNLTGDKAFDLTTNLFGGGGSLASTKYGQVASSGQSAGNHWSTAGRDIGLSTSSTVTFAILSNTVNLGGPANFVMSVGPLLGWVEYGSYFRVHRRWAGLGRAYAFDSTVSAAGSWSLKVATSYADTTTPGAWIDGRPISLSYIGWVGMGTTSPPPMYVCGSSDGTNFGAATLAFARMWNRPLTTAEMCDMVSDPWALYRHRPDPIIGRPTVSTRSGGYAWRR